jgi:hypothetical protein
MTEVRLKHEKSDLQSEQSKNAINRIDIRKILFFKLLPSLFDY